MTFNRLITKINRTQRTNKKNEWLVIHYVGAVSTAQNNAKYFEKEYRGASANYFVDPISIWQVVEDYDDAWHVGARKYYNDCRNSNSIGIEMCCKKDSNGNWYIEEETIKNTIWLTKMICDKYKIPLSHVVRHYDVTHKICPEPFVRNPELWDNFKKELSKEKVEMFVDDEKALNYLVEKGRITNKEYWQKALAVVKNLNFLIIKWANDLRELEMKNGLI